MEAYLYLLNYFFILLISVFILKLFSFLKKDKLNLKKEAKLLVLEGKEKLALKEEEIILSPSFSIAIGRDENNDLIIYDHFVSKKHAFIFEKEKQFYIEDLGSSNGTFINNQKILKSHLLSSGDEIRIGEVIFKFNKTYTE